MYGYSRHTPVLHKKGQANPRGEYERNKRLGSDIQKLRRDAATLELTDRLGEETGVSGYEALGAALRDREQSAQRISDLEARRQQLAERTEQLTGRTQRLTALRDYAGTGAVTGLTGYALARSLLPRMKYTDDTTPWEAASALRRRRRLAAVIGLGSAGLGMGALHFARRTGKL